MVIGQVGWYGGSDSSINARYGSDLIKVCMDRTQSMQGRDQLNQCGKASVETSGHSSHAPCPHRITRTPSRPHPAPASGTAPRAHPMPARLNHGRRPSRARMAEPQPCTHLPRLQMRVAEASIGLRHPHANHGGASIVVGGRQPATPDLLLKHPDETFVT